MDVEHHVLPHAELVEEQVALGLQIALGALGLLGWGLVILRAQDYVASAILVLTGLSIMRAGIELLRPTVGE